MLEKLYFAVKKLDIYSNSLFKYVGFFIAWSALLLVVPGIFFVKFSLKSLNKLLEKLISIFEGLESPEFVIYDYADFKKYLKVFLLIFFVRPLKSLFIALDFVLFAVKYLSKFDKFDEIFLEAFKLKPEDKFWKNSG
jgi:hypothetical protein